MTDVALQLGPIVFQDFEIPSGVNFGGKQRLALHRLPNGSRVIDALGRDDAQICFCGIFAGPDAVLRARSLDALRVAGIALPLTWDVLFYTVLIGDFCADYRNSWWIPYRIVCTVLHDEASGFLTPTVSVATSVLGDVSAAADCASDAGLNISMLQIALSAPGATTRGTAAYMAAQAAITDARSLLGTAVGATEVALMGTDIANAGSAQTGVADLLAATDAAGQLSSLVLGDSYVHRAATNLANAST